MKEKTLSEKGFELDPNSRDYNTAYYEEDVKQCFKEILDSDLSCIKLNDLPQDILDLINERNVKVSYMVDREIIKQKAGFKELE